MLKRRTLPWKLGYKNLKYLKNDQRYFVEIDEISAPSTKLQLDPVIGSSLALTNQPPAKFPQPPIYFPPAARCAQLSQLHSSRYVTTWQVVTPVETLQGLA